MGTYNFLNKSINRFRHRFIPTSMLLFALFAFVTFLKFNTISAETMDSSQFKIEGEDVGVIPADQTENSDNLYTLLSPQDLLKFQRAGYVIKTDTTLGLQFSISDLSISFDLIEPGNFSSQSVGLRVDLDNVGYQIYSYQQSPLRSLTGDLTIAQTSCDNNSRPCTFNGSAPWTNPKNTGLGYNITNSTVAGDFRGPTYFRPFHSGIPTQPSFIIRKISGGPSQSQFTIKLSTEGPAQNYQGEVVLLTVPNF